MQQEILTIDGSYGESGGQILRTALALSCLLKKPFKIINIRKKRPNPGLAPQHLTTVLAAKKITEAEIQGAELGSMELLFIPKTLKSGEFFFDIKTAGSITLMLQTLSLALAFGTSPSKIKIIGGTHVPFSPPFDYLKEVTLKILEKMGVQTDIKIKKYGFYPKGGGEIEFKISPVTSLSPINLVERGELKKIKIIANVANLNLSIAEREKKAALDLISSKLSNSKIETEIKNVPSIGVGTYIFILAEFENSIAGFSSLGEKGKPAEKVGKEAASAFLNYLNSGKALDKHLADQLIPWISLVKEKSMFTTEEISNHTLTNCWVTKKFLNVEFEIDSEKNLIVKK